MAICKLARPYVHNVINLLVSRCQFTSGRHSVVVIAANYVAAFDSLSDGGKFEA